MKFQVTVILPVLEKDEVASDPITAHLPNEATLQGILRDLATNFEQIECGLRRLMAQRHFCH